jgi:amino acid transporter
MTNYTLLDVADPLAFVFQHQGTTVTNWFAGIISISAVFVIASVLLVYQLGQPRIWMSMSRDGLLPKIFARIHPKFKTPSFSTILTGVLVGFPAMFLNLDVVIALTSIGTLFAFVLVCGGILVLQQRKNKPESKFKVPYLNGKYLIPILFLGALISTIVYSPDHFHGFITLEGIPMLIFWIVAAIVAAFSFKNSFSVIPVLGLLSCFYLMAQESYTNWLRFFIWLIIGLSIYFIYGRHNSRIGKNGSEAEAEA